MKNGGPKAARKNKKTPVAGVFKVAEIFKILSLGSFWF